MKFEKNLRRIIAVLFAGMCVQSVVAAPAATATNKWIAVNGNWGDGENWSLGHSPTETELAYFDFSGYSVEVTIDKEYTVGWTTVMVLAGEIEDIPAIHGLEFRIVEASGSVVLQCRKDAGFRFIVR